jgi:hypothetical protein
MRKKDGNANVKNSGIGFALGLVEEVCGGSPLFFIPILADRVF